MKNAIKVSAPATIANLNCGFDILGTALDKVNDEIIGRLYSEPGVHLKRVGPYARQTPEDPRKNTAAVAVSSYLEYLGAYKTTGFEMELHKKTRPGSGLGSSASSACAAVMLANELMGAPLDKKELLPFALIGEHAADGAFHADNVAPCLMGGMVLVRDMLNLEVHKLTYPSALSFAVVFPEVKVLTAESRAQLGTSVPLKDVTTQTANIAALVHGLIRGDLDLIGDAMVDVIVEPQRAKLIPGFYAMRDAAFTNGAMSFGISGSGPTVFALCPNTHVAGTCVEEIQKVLKESGVESEGFYSGINQSGTVLC